MTKLTIGHIVNVHVAGTLFQAFPFIQDLIGPAPRTMIRQRTYTLSTSAFARDAGSSPDWRIESHWAFAHTLAQIRGEVKQIEFLVTAQTFLRTCTLLADWWTRQTISGYFIFIGWDRAFINTAHVGQILLFISTTQTLSGYIGASIASWMTMNTQIVLRIYPTSLYLALLFDTDSVDWDPSIFAL